MDEQMNEWMNDRWSNEQIGRLMNEWLDEFCTLIDLKHSYSSLMPILSVIADVKL